MHWIAFGLGVGALPLAPGTFGTLLAVPLYLLLDALSAGPYLLVVAVLFLAGVGICGQTARALAVHDHPAIVFDEVVGFLIAMTAAPTGAWWIVAGFVLFRLFDIWKPWPVRWVDRRVAGGWGIMLDDAVAGFYAAAVLQLAAFLNGAG